MSVGAATTTTTQGSNTDSNLLLQLGPSASTEEAPLYADCCVSAGDGQTLVDTIVETAHHADNNARLEYGVMLSDTDVSNGFVKDGTSLPYVFEANESGARKRSTKILPVCGMCGKKFVCVTTMKRHLVTHTGEKPFSCKICGKQYTQKGNLRVHERTHRNDRPFECNICTQKFYRKEPMQKHQWRQHGIVHLKSRPSAASSNNSTVSTVIGAEGMLYKSLNMDGSNGGINQSMAVPANTLTTTPASLATSVVSTPASLATAVISEPELATSYHLVEASSLESLNQQAVNSTAGAEILDSPIAYIVQSSEDEVQYASIEVYTETEEPDHLSQNNVQETIILNTQDIMEGFTTVATDHEETVTTKEESTESATNEVHDHEESHSKPVKLKMKLAQAYLREIEESREHELIQERMNGGRDQTSGQPLDISNFQLCSAKQESDQPDNGSLEAIVAKLTLPEQQSTVNVTENSSLQEYHPKQQPHSSDHPDTLEFLCKSCGSKCQVSDPYSFRCSTCNMKYTSLPTHLIAEPLQCIGCVQIFPHKPALKQHQSSGVKERPFKCCKCGFEFRQKAHLQKHQWRIHRKKYDTSVDSTPKETEQVSMTAVESHTEVVTPVTLAPTNEVQRLVTDQEASPLDLSPAKMYGTAGSITKWVEQVETARNPIKPDISIHKKQASEGEEMVRFKDLLSRPPVNQVIEHIELQIINPLNGGKQESLAVHLVDKKANDARPVYAFKSRPVLQVQHVGNDHLDKLNRDVEENPLLNQIVESVPSTSLSIIPANISTSCPRSPKRARTEEESMPPPSGPVTGALAHPTDVSQPADLSFTGGVSSLQAQLRASPLAVKTTPPLRLETQYSTVSPPLNLSNSGRSAGPQVSPYDYRISKSAGISGHFQRLKSQDERSGI